MRCLLVVVLPLALGLAVHRDESQMAPVDEVEYPTPAASDAVAGTPGSGVVDAESGPAHHTSTEQAQDPCDMTGSSGSLSPGEDPYVVHSPNYDPTQPPTHSWEQDKDTTNSDYQVLPEHEFVCRETVRWPEIVPAIVSPFNLIRSQFEGNDRRGAADSSMYEVMSCGCMCSGLNPQCGQPGSMSYYSGVPTASDCAQMICHANRFRKCFWNGRIVARGLWITNAVKFNSSALELESTESYEPPQIDIPTPPSPSPSPSVPHVPTFEEKAQIAAMELVELLIGKFCINASKAALAEIRHDLSLVNTSEVYTPQCGFVADAAPTRVASVADIASVAKQDNNVANAMAGYSGSTPLAADPTRHASMAMNSVPTGALLQVEGQERSVEEEAFNLLVGLLEKNLPKDELCAAGSPSIRFLVVAALHANSTCSSVARRQHVLLQGGSPKALQSAVEVYSALISEMRNVVRQSGQGPSTNVPAAVSPSPSPPSPTTNTDTNPTDLNGDGSGSGSGSGNGGGSGDSGADNEDDDGSYGGDQHESENIANDMNPPLFPAGAPGPADVGGRGGGGYSGGPVSMEDAVTVADCEDGAAGTDLSANFETRQDHVGSPAGAVEWPTFDQSTTRVDLPLFGHQQLQFEPRDPLPVLTQPLLLDDENYTQ